MKACHAGKPVPKAEIQGDRCRNRKPHICRGGSRRNGIPGGSPAPVTVRLGKMAFAVTGSTAIFLTFAGAFFTLLCGSAHGRAVAGKSQVLRIDQIFLDGAV